MPRPEVKYRFYATLLDGYQNYLDSDKIWEKYWGWSENPPHTPEEFRLLQFQSLIDRINRVPFQSDAADRGTVFNEIIDRMVENRTAGDIPIEAVPGEDGKPVAVKGTLGGKDYLFDIALCRKTAAEFKGGLAQQYVSGILPTVFGNVELYGYIDYLMPQSVHDLKTTSRYAVGKFKSNWQHLVYPYCLRQDGMYLDLFEYDVVELDRCGRWETFKETYVYSADRDEPKLRRMCEELIGFLRENRALITDRKVFGQVNDRA